MFTPKWCDGTMFRCDQNLVWCDVFTCFFLMADIHVACCEMRAVRNGTLLSLRFSTALNPAGG